MKDFFKKAVILIIPFILSGLVLINLYSEFKVEQPNEISYNEFVNMLEENKINDVVINFKEDTFYFIDNNEKKYVTDNPKYENFKKDLLESGVKIEEQHTTDYTGTILSFVSVSVSVGLFFMLFRQLKGVGKSNTQKQIATKPNVKFDDVAGLKEVKKDMTLLVDYLKNPKKYKDKGAKPPKGVILYGPPGTGKTLLAKALAGEAGVPFYSASGSQFVEMFVGMGAKRIRELFAEAKKNAPSIIFIDEIDAIGGKRQRSMSNNSEQLQTINELLNQIGGFNDCEGVMVIGATNRLDDLDEALIRPGRFDKQIIVPAPQTPAEREEVINLYIKNKKLSDDVKIENLVKETKGFSPSSIETLLNEATLISVQENKEVIDVECIDKAMYKMVFKGNAKEDKDRDLNDDELVTYHEVGHAFLARKYGVEVSKVTTTPSTSGVGGVTFMTPKETGFHSIKSMEEEVKISYGGRIAELLLRGDESLVTTGASNDIQRATSIISDMVTNYGMNPKIGMLNLHMLDIHSDEIILNECQKISNRLYEEAKKDIFDNKDIIVKIAKVLLEKETISGEELDRIIKDEEIVESDNTISEIKKEVKEIAINEDIKEEV